MRIEQDLRPAEEEKPYLAKTGLLRSNARDSPPKWELAAEEAPLLFSPEKEFNVTFWDFTHINVLLALQPPPKKISIKIGLQFVPLSQRRIIYYPRGWSTLYASFPHCKL